MSTMEDVFLCSDPSQNIAQPFPIRLYDFPKIDRNTKFQIGKSPNLLLDSVVY